MAKALGENSFWSEMCQCQVEIKDGEAVPPPTKERVEEMNKRFFSFLEDEMLIEYLNENFICYKFNISSEDLNFQGNLANLFEIYFYLEDHFQY